MQDCNAARRRARALATDRNDTSRGMAMILRMGMRTPLDKDETTDLQGARANRLHIHLQEKRVARLAECRLKQKMGYYRHTINLQRYVF